MYFDNNKNIDDYFKRSLKNYSQVPDDNVWENIEWRLSQEKKVRRMFFLKVAAGLLIFVGLTTFLFFEISYFTGSEKALSSMNLDEELKISMTREVEKNSDGTYNERKHNRVIPSDVSVPNSLLSNRTLQNQTIAKEESSIQEEESLHKLTALNTTFDNKETKQPKHPVFSELSKRNFINTYRKEKSDNDLSQNNIGVASEQPPKNMLSLSGSFSPILSYRNTKMTTSNDGMSREKSMLSYSGGMDIGYSISDKLTLRTGMHYTKLGQSLNGIEVSSDSYAMDGENTVIKIASSIGPGQIKMNSLVEQDDSKETPKYVTHDNSVPPEFTIEPALYQTFEMVKMPFMLEYTLLDNQFDVSMIGGVNANLLVEEGIFMEQAETSQRIGSTKELSKLSYSGTLGIGLKYDVGEAAQLFMKPSFDYYITSLSSDNSYKTFPYYFGFFSGVSIAF
ncbi:MAG: hypothetical protein ACQESJ_00965 [Bacteroidota bacterium]